MAKHRPRLNVFGRQLLVHRIVDEHWPVAQAADAVGVSRATAYKWLHNRS
jgi:transposase